MRILMFGWEFPPYISGGLGTACLGITEGLVGLGNEVAFVMPSIEEEQRGTGLRLLSAFPSPSSGPFPSLLGPYINEEQYQALRARYGGAGAKSRPAMRGDYGPNLLAEVWRYGKAADKIVQREQFDIIHGHDWTSVIASVRAKGISGRPLIYHVHALEYDRSGENINRAVYDLEKYGMEAADHVLAVSHYTKARIVNRYGIAPEKITVVHNAVSRMESDFRRSKKREDEKTVLFLGRITFQKGPDYFVEAAALASKALPGVRFVMAGAGDMMPRMIERVADLKMGAHFHFPGFLRGEEVERIYAMSDLYVMPSVSEPFGISPLEAMHYDVPVIISRQSGVAEILRHALKVDFWDVKELANKMIALLKYPSLGDEMTRQAREELKNIRWENAARKILSVYRQVLAMR